MIYIHQSIHHPQFYSSAQMAYELTWHCLATNISGRTYEYSANMNIDMNIHIDIRRITEYTQTY